MQFVNCYCFIFQLGQMNEFKSSVNENLLLIGWTLHLATAMNVAFWFKKCKRKEWVVYEHTYQRN